MPFALATDGTRIAYETMGSGEPLLLVSGQASDRTSWDGIRDDFAEDRMVIVYDHRGTGASDKPEAPPYSTRGFADDAIALLDHLGIERAHAYGISMGGRICQWLGIDHGDRIGALVLGATTPGNAHGVRRPADIDAALASADLPRLLDAMVSPEWVKRHPEFLAKMAEAALHPIPVCAQKLHYRASEGHDTWDLLPKITAPTLVIHGSNDEVNMTANAALLASRIRGAELCIIEGERHGYALEFREKASRVVKDFLARHPLPADDKRG